MNLKNYFFISILICSSCQSPDKGTHPTTPIKKNNIENSELPEAPKPILPDDDQNFIQGIIMSTGLDEQSIQDLGLNTGDFQLIGENNSYYLETKFDLKPYWGQCVKVYGDTLEFNKNIKAHHYHRNIIVTTSILPDKGCVYNKESKEEKLESFKKNFGNHLSLVNYLGTIKRQKRPAPDIHYDYSFHFNSPIEIEGDPRGDGFMTNHISILPIDDEMRKEFEAAIKSQKAISIQGYLLGGYADTMVLYVVEIK